MAGELYSVIQEFRGKGRVCFFVNGLSKNFLNWASWVGVIPFMSIVPFGNLLLKNIKVGK